MADELVATGAAAATLDRRPALVHGADVLRDIARGGIAGIVVGLLVAGLGGRLVMRLATILHEDTVGFRTENGEIIGDISLRGTLALMTFGGLGMGLLAGTVWVIVSPWIPGRRLTRASLTAVAAVALGTPPIIQRSNPDFIILDHDPVVVVLLVGLVALVGFSIALLDGALDARLPRPDGRIAGPTLVYAIVTIAGLVLILPLVITFLLNGPEYRAPIRAAWALAITGACTLVWWFLCLRGRMAPPESLALVGRLSLAAAVVLGFVTGVPHVLSAAGIAVR